MEADAHSASATSGESAQRRLLAALVAPEDHGPVEIVAEETAGSAILAGAIFSRATGARIATISDFQLDFVNPGEGESLESLRERTARGEIPRRIESAPEWRLARHDAPEIRYDGPVVSLSDPDMVAVEPPTSLAFQASGDVEALLFAHPWSGEAELSFGGRTQTVDLYEPHTVIPRPVMLDLGPQTQTVTIRPTGRVNPLAQGRQALFGGFRERTGRSVPLRHRKRIKVQGSQFTPEFYAMLDEIPPTGLLLDIGGGIRQLDEPRYINLDYASYAECDLIGDATRLPFRDASVDAVYSSAVFEHIPDPIRAGSEVARVLKPGGKALIAWAFMQPIHSEGAHFYNATPWGVERAFAPLKLTKMWYETSLAFLIDWGARESGLRGLVPDAEIAAVCETLKKWDALIPENRKPYMAGGIWAAFEKI